MLARALALVALTVGVILSAPATAHAETKTSYGCTSSRSSALHMTATRIRYDSSRSAIYASATQSYKEVLRFKPDVVWTFDHFQSSGLQTRHDQPTQWGSRTAPIPNVVRWVDVYWRGVNGGGGKYSALCRTTVGRGVESA